MMQVASANLHASHSLHTGAMQSDNSLEFLDHTLKAFWEVKSLRIAPSNFSLAKQCLEGLLKRLHHNPEVRCEYHAVMQGQLQHGIIEKVADESSQGTSRTVHYLPHHAVISTDKTTTKLRIVYDASAKAGGPSLTECLFSGPKFKQSILVIILWLRCYKVPLVADVEKAFLMVSVCEQDRDALRFLWVDDIEKASLMIVPMRFTRVVFGVPASPFLLNVTETHHLLKYHKSYPALVDTLLQFKHVDDVTYGADSDNKAYQLYLVSKKVFAEAGFNLCTFITNSTTLQSRIAANDQGAGYNHTDCSNAVVEEDSTYTSGLLTGGSTSGGQKVLGISWHPPSNTFEFDIARSLHALQPTKSNIVGVASRFYD